MSDMPSPEPFVELLAAGSMDTEFLIPLLDDNMRAREADDFFDACFSWLGDAPDGAEEAAQACQQSAPTNGSASGYTSSSVEAPDMGSSASDTPVRDLAPAAAAAVAGGAPSAAPPTAAAGGTAWSPPQLRGAAVAVPAPSPAMAPSSHQNPELVHLPSAGASGAWAPSMSHAPGATRTGYPQQQQQQQHPHQLPMYQQLLLQLQQHQHQLLSAHPLGQQRLPPPQQQQQQQQPRHQQQQQGQQQQHPQQHQQQACANLAGTTVMSGATNGCGHPFAASAPSPLLQGPPLPPSPFMLQAQQPQQPQQAQQPQQPQQPQQAQQPQQPQQPQQAQQPQQPQQHSTAPSPAAQLLTSSIATDKPLEQLAQASSSSGASRAGNGRARLGSSPAAWKSSDMLLAPKCTVGLAKRRVASGNCGPMRSSGSSAGRDTTQRKNAEIAKLEAELQQKLKLASSLQRENQELASKERMLKQQVPAKDQQLFCEPVTVEGITPRLVSILQGFRSTYNKLLGANLLGQGQKDSRAFGMKDFVAAWQRYVQEAADLLPQPERNGKLAEACQRASSWCMSVCIYAPDVIQKASTVNMKTGEDLPGDVSQHFYKALVSKMGLNAAQINDLRCVFALHANIAQRTSTDVTQLWQQIARMVETDTAKGGIGGITGHAGLSSRVELLEQLTLTFRQLQVRQRQCDMVHTLLAFLVSSVLTHRQKALMAYNAFPYFPNLKFLLVAVLP